MGFVKSISKVNFFRVKGHLSARADGHFLFYFHLTYSKRLLYHGYMMQQAMISMDCSTCKIECRSFGRHRNGLRRFRCQGCKKTYTEPHRPRVETSPLGDLRMPMEKAVLALQLLVEGSSVRTTERITGLHRDTI